MYINNSVCKETEYHRVTLTHELSFVPLMQYCTAITTVIGQAIS